MSKRFVVDENNVLIEDSHVIIKGKEVHHINVLRYKIGDSVYINENQIKIEKISRDLLEGSIVGKLPVKGVPNINITLVQSYLKSDKMEYVVQKAVELGVKNIIPVITKNTIVKMDEKDKVKKVERLSRIAKEAVEQCGRADNVCVENVQKLANVKLNEYDKVLVCHELSSISLKTALSSMRNIKNIAVIIGPEGGLESSEVERIIENENTLDISLGDRILRAETASLAILSILGYEYN